MNGRAQQEVTNALSPQRQSRTVERCRGGIYDLTRYVMASYATVEYSSSTNTFTHAHTHTYTHMIDTHTPHIDVYIHTSMIHTHHTCMNTHI